MLGLDAAGATRTAMVVEYFGQSMSYTRIVKGIVAEVSNNIETFVQKELERFQNHRSIPLALIIALSIFVPVVAYVTLQATTSMFK